ncbi:MAG: guanylate kinase [Oscillospiraceae bacterium]
MRGKLIVLRPYLRAGKSTVIRQILERHPDFFFSVSATTRQPRGGERDGVHYHFITPAQFEGMIAGQALLEYNHYASGDYYGTPAEPVRRVLDRGGTVLLDVGPMARFRFWRKLPQAVMMVFLAPPRSGRAPPPSGSRGDTPPDRWKPG